MSFRKFEQHPLPSAEKREKKEKMEYNPIVPVRHDFSSDWIYRNEKGEAVIDDSDLKQIMNFYRKEIKRGTLLNLGAGSVHLHYMSILEDKLTHITALDLSEKNLQVLREFLDAWGPEAVAKKRERQYVSEEDVVVLETTAEAGERLARKKNLRKGDEIMLSLRKKSLTEDGKYDFIVGDMQDLDRLEQRKFDNIIVGFAIFVNKEEELSRLFQQIKERLNPGGKVIIVDFHGFTAQDVKDEFAENGIITEKYPNFIDLSLPFLITSLEKAGFSKNAIKAREADVKVSEKEKKFKYLFVSAENKK